MGRAQNSEPEVVRHHRHEGVGRREFLGRHRAVGDHKQRLEGKPAVPAELASEIHGIVHDVGSMRYDLRDASRLAEPNPDPMRMRLAQGAVPAVGVGLVPRPNPFPIIGRARGVHAVVRIRNHRRADRGQRDILRPGSGGQANQSGQGKGQDDRPFGLRRKRRAKSCSILHEWKVSRPKPAPRQAARKSSPGTACQSSTRASGFAPASILTAGLTPPK